ncbi:hypothetical protein [Blastopirellula marina]|uniref:STAS/SEC14 domain-containing protein n=1 Tax=Blastopirellula marina DSM 3645 TaxID=314230 RepID=A3ZRX5_9BACT|nr:hypothetical protein [Blastopirellula marina]EAQ80897.1 hypothetical protein DSM3645_12791 [Blastopirellula marina DSM 3645]
MVSQVDFTIEDDILVAKVSGVWRKPADSLATLQQILEKAEAEDLHQVLYLSEVTGSAPSTLEAHFLGERAAAILGPLVLGYVPVAEREAKLEESVRFITQVAQNRGLLSRQFADQTAARGWLSRQRAG